MSEEDSERRGPRHISDAGQTCGGADEILFGDAHLEEAFGMSLGELVDLGGVAEITVEDDSAGVGGAEFDEFVTPCIPHGLHAWAPLLLVGLWSRISSSSGSSSRRAFSK